MGPYLSYLCDDELALVFFNKKANITVATILYTSNRESILTASRPYMYEQLIFVVPNPIPRIQSNRCIILPIQIINMDRHSYSTLTSFYSDFHLQHNDKVYELIVGRGNQSPYLNLIYAFLVGTVYYEPRKKFARLIVIVWIIACMVLRTAYQGQLFTLMKMNKLKDRVRSINDLIERNSSVKLPEELLTFVTFDQRIEKK